MSNVRENIVENIDESVEFPDLENIIMNIFTSCDIKKNGSVPVSKLIEFISPYIDFNSAHLEELRKALDPLQQDSYVTSEVFYNSMKAWTEKFKTEFQANCTPAEITDPNSKRLSDVDERQSTPTKNFAKGFFKGEYESGILNLSNISSYSYAGSTAGGVDPAILQEQINELQHQNKKLNEMISDVRIQLNISEEQNGILQNDIERITKRLQAEQKVNEHLQKERKENDEYRDNTNNVIKKYETLNQNLISYKKENSQLKDQIADSENEIHKLQEVIRKFRSNDAKKNEIIDKLKIEVAVREKEITTLEECKTRLNQICKEKDDILQQLNDETQHLQYEKIALENRLAEVISRSATILQEEKREASEPERSPSPRMSKSLSPNVSSVDDDYYWNSVLSTVKPYESLQSELMQVSTAGCIGPCDHKMKITQFEQELENLQCELKEHENCQTLIEKYERELKESKERVDKYENDIKALQTQLYEAKSKLRERVIETKLLTETQEKLRLEEREKSELLNSNKILIEQMTIYKENYLLAQLEISTLNEEYSRKKKELDETKEQLVHLNEEFGKISSKYEENEKILKEMQEENEDDKIYKDSYLAAQEENLKLKADRDTLKLDLEAKAKLVEKLEYEYTAIKEINKENKNKLQAVNTEMENKLQEIHAEHELKMNEIISQQEKKIKHLDWLIVQKSGLEDSLDKYKKKYEDAIDQLSQIAGLRTNYQVTLAQLKERENEVLKLEEDMEATTAQIDSLEAAQEQAKIKWTKQETEMNEKITALEKEISALQQKLTDTTSAELTTCKNCSDLEIERKSTTKTEPRRTTRVELLHHKIEKLDEQLDEEKNRSKVLAANLTKVQNEKNDLENKLAQIDNERKALLLQKDSSQMKIKKLTHSIQGLELKVNTYRTTIEDISKQVEYRTKDIAQMEMRFSDLQLKSNKISHKHSLLVTHIGVVQQKIMDQKKILGGNTLYAVSVWRNLLENVSPTSPVLQQDPSELASTSSDSTAGPLDEEIHNLEQQINLTCILLKTLAKLRDQFQTPTGHGDGSSTSMEKSAESGNESLLSAVVKRKFVLKPASFILHTNPLTTSPMSPDSPAAEVTEVSTAKEYASPPRVESNNNDILMDQVKLRSSVEKKSGDDEKRTSFASDLTDSGSTSDSGSSESLGIEVVAKRYTNTKDRLSAGESKIENEKEVQEGLARQFRSMSEGAVVTHQLTHDGDVTVFPNLRDNVLETLGLLPDGQAKERLSEDEIEVKFQTLTLAFAIDAVTLADRRDRQRRQRDQAEHNMETEVARLTHAIHRLNPLCVDAETTEMVTSLLSQLDVILQASNRISTSAEVFGSVQQEWRLAESVNVMLSHLRNLRQQRDTARRQLQCTKRMLQESTTSTEATNPANRPRILPTSGRVMTRRRASIATITRPLESPRSGTGSNGCAAALVDGTVTRRVITRRTSAAIYEPSPRHWDSRIRPDWSPVDRPATLLRSRPNRLELGVDLVKIKEGTAESSTSESFEKYDSDTEFKTPTAVSDDNLLQDEVILAEPTTLRGHIRRKLQQFGAQIEGFWNYLVEQGTVHEICCLGAIICFAMCTIIIGNLYLEVEYARRGVPVRKIPLSWLTLDEITKLIFGELRTSNPPY